MRVCISTGSRSTRRLPSARPSRRAGLIARQSQIAQILQCAEIVGILDTVLHFTIQWGFDRHSFGRPIGSYQALKHKYADLKIWFESCRATTNAAVKAVAARSPGAEMAVSVAKSYVGEHAPGMLQDCVQLHGGIGVTWEHDLHLFLRRVTLYRSMFGTPEDHNLRVYALTESGVRVMTETTSAPTARPSRSTNSRHGPGPGWRTTCRRSIRTTHRNTTGAKRNRGFVPVSFKRSSTTAVSRVSVSRGNMADSACPSPTRRPSTPNPGATSCRSS